jgi:hypothetical protein
MAKRAAQDIKNKTSRSRKTKKRLAIKNARLIAHRTKRGKDGKKGKK